MPRIEHQHLNLPMQEVVKNEIIKWLDVVIIYPITNTKWVRVVHCMMNRGGITVVPN